MNKYSGRFNTSNQKSYVDWAEYYSKSTPGPQVGTLPAVKIGGGRFNESRPKSYIALVEYTSWQLGPADYAEDFTKPRKLPGGGRISANIWKESVLISQGSGVHAISPELSTAAGSKIMGGEVFHSVSDEPPGSCHVLVQPSCHHQQTILAREANSSQGADFPPMSLAHFSTLDWVRKRAKKRPPAAYDASDFRGGDYVSRPKLPVQGNWQRES